jgi:hypothetical protein
MKKTYLLTLFVLLNLIYYACRQDNKQVAESSKKNAPFIVDEFDALSNFNSANSDSIKKIELDYQDAMNTGFIIPTIRQISGGNFICKFRIKNNSGKDEKYNYKIYYQNESYKFPEVDSNLKSMNEYASENFYGSWEDSMILFKSTELIPSDNQFHVISDSIHICGNPRNEAVCFSKGINNRWKRNPRVGVYSFLLVVSSPDTSSKNKIPDWIKSINHKEGNKFISPYYFFLYGKGSKMENVSSTFSKNSLKVIAHPNLGSGIFYEGIHYKDSANHYEKNNCGNDVHLYNQAPFSQFIHYIDKTTRLENIPVIDDVLAGNYSKRDYNWNRGFYKKEELISSTPMTADHPCETVFSDPVNKKIIIHNPKTTPGKWRKENVGVISRHGLCYGKIRVKAKLTELLNRNNVWNGITNAIWMINQGGDGGEWNLRRPCKKAGYMATYWGGEEDNRVERVGYSEIDFEILKTPPYCPDQTFPPVYKNPTNDPRDLSSWNTPLPDEIIKDDGNITVACTNWDMACWEPENFGVGCNTIKYNNQEFQSHRWNHTYRALTEKSPQPDDSLFTGPYYFFEIDWRPTEIIWRIGPEENKMKVVGYMNEKVSSIPNNQMLLIITQEFHNTKWWPGSPYQQKNIPFPLNDIFGEILDVTIE